MRIQKLSDHVGVEVSDIDLRQSLDAETKKTLHDAAVDNICLVVRDQSFTPETFNDAAGIFGEVMDQDHPKYSFPGLPGIKRHSNRNIDAAGNRIKEGMYWHTDGAYREAPPKFTLLYAVELPDHGGNTNVFSMRAAYESLPQVERDRLDQMKTMNFRLGSAARHRQNGNNVALMAQGKHTPMEHPLVRTNHDNGAKGLWFNPNTVENIVGMDPEQSQDFLYDLMDRLIRPEFTYSHTWRVGDLFMWDNRSSLHKVTFDYDFNQHRLHYHATIRGERPH